MKWTEDEIELIISLIRSGKKYSEISKITNRSESSIRSKAYLFDEKYSSYYKEKKEDIKCLECGIFFSDLISRDRKFCSQKCNATFNNKLRGVKTIEIKKEKNPNYNKCLNCQFETKGKFCSRDCQNIFYKNEKFNKIENGDTSINERYYKKYLIYKFGNKCMECGWDKINRKTGNVPIQLEHIDGNSENNNLDNLKLLCPSCHSLTETYGSLNIGKGRKKRYNKQN